MNSRGAEFENRSSTDFSGNSNATAFSESDVRRLLSTLEWIGVSDCRLGGGPKRCKKFFDRIASSSCERWIRRGNRDNDIARAPFILQPDRLHM